MKDCVNSFMGNLICNCRKIICYCQQKSMQDLFVLNPHKHNIPFIQSLLFFQQFYAYLGCKPKKIIARCMYSRAQIKTSSLKKNHETNPVNVK